MPRLLHIMDYEPSGTRTFDDFVIGLAHEAKNRGWLMDFAFGAEPPKEFAKALIELGARYAVIPFPFTMASSRLLFHRIGSVKYDVIQTSFLSAFSWPVLWLKLRGRCTRLIVIDHSSGTGHVRRGIMRLIAKVRGFLAGRVVDAIAPVSHTVAKRDIEEVFLPKEKIKVIYNGIMLDRFPCPERNVREFVRVAFAGQMISEKGVLTLLKAHEIIQQRGELRHELYLAGKGPQEKEFKEYATSANLKNIRFLGHIDSIPTFFGEADIVVVPSIWFEAFGLVLAESMACGAACIVSDSGALPEIVGDAGLIFKAGDAADLADKLQKLIEDPAMRRTLRTNGRKRAEKKYQIKTKVNRQFALCEAVCGLRFD
jgi:glycosyltransferase involved in cell wall biosynthesis